MRTAMFTAAIGAVFCFSTPALAQTEAPSTRNFVQQVALEPRSSERPLARWEDNICVGAVGLSVADAQTLVDRISVRARSVGLDPGAPGCRANVMVIYAPDADALTRQIVDQRRDLLGYYTDGGAVVAGREELDEFANVSRPVRWWYIASEGAGAIQSRPGAEMDRQSSGRSQAAAAAGDGGSVTGIGAGDIQGMESVRTNGTRARTALRNELTYALVVVDARRVANLQPSAWMDYVAMVALAQIDPSASTQEFDTILNLFSTAPSQTALSSWDDAYLKALYRARRDSGGNRQFADVARRMSENISH
ncbi:hypothetical protein [Candidatus Viadribacter manganicus]|nr:hypothetical protein [Candidatus Viadribacter manganicus]